MRKLTGDIPEDRERGLPLLTVHEPVWGLEDIVLSPGNRSLSEGLLREHNREEVLKAHGLRPSDRVLLCGPPGCGKTLTAEVIAFVLDRPPVIVRTDSVVSSIGGAGAARTRSRPAERVVEEVEARIERESHHVDKFCTFKLGLVDDLLTGRVRVPVSEEAPV